MNGNENNNEKNENKEGGGKKGKGVNPLAKELYQKAGEQFEANKFEEAIDLLQADLYLFLFYRYLPCFHFFHCYFHLHSFPSQAELRLLINITFILYYIIFHFI